MSLLSALAVGATALCACSSGSGSMTDAAYKSSVTDGMASSLQASLQSLVAGVTALQKAAPDAVWDANDPAVPKMRAAWVQARQAYEEIEGATAPIFPNIDLSIDGRVEDFGPAPAGTGALNAQCDMFSAECVTGLHAIERILYVDTTPASVVAYETGLGYVPPQSFPATAQEADDFKNKLCAKAVTDATTLLQGWTGPMIDIGSAFDGLVSLMNEQQEKVTKAGLDQEESRYSQHTMDDLRNNLTGTSNIYTLFEPWIQSKSGGPAIDKQIRADFTGLNILYTSTPYQGDAFPAPPADWSDTSPSPADLQTPFGQLFSAVAQQVDPTQSGSVVFEMNAAATKCGLPVFSGQ